MALSTTPVQSASSTAASGNLTSPTLSSSATAGNLLVLAASRAGTHGIGGAWPAVSGFTPIHDSGVNNGNMGAAGWFKIAGGGETTVSFSGETNPVGNWTCSLVEYAAPDGGWASPPLAVKAEDESGLSSTGTTQSSGTTGANSVAEAFSVAIFGVDGNSFGTESFTNSYVTAHKVTSGGRAQVLQAVRVLSSAGTHETTITIGTADERYGCIAVFEADAGDPPSVTLDTADATAFTTLTPTLLFTGTDPDADDIVYQVQIANNSAFAGGGVTLTYEHNSGSGVVHPNPVGFVVSNGTSADGNQQVDDRPGLSMVWGGGILDEIHVLIGRDETDTDGVSLVRVYTSLDGTPGTDARPAGATTTYDRNDTPTPGWAAVSTTEAHDSSSSATPIWYEYEFTGANRIQTVSGAAGMPVVDWVPNGTYPQPNTNTIAIQSGTAPSGENGWIDGQVSANYGVQTFGPKIRVYEDQQRPVDAASDADAGFANQDNGGDTSPFTSGDQIGYTVQSALTAGLTYYWRVRGSDGTAFGAWSSTRTFTVSASTSSDGTAAGSSTASAVGSALASAAGSAAGTASANATATALSDASGTAAGSATAAATASALADAAVTAAGTSTASATSETDASTGTAAGTSTATAIGSSLSDATATAAGTSTASATADSDASTGTAAGSATASAVGSSLASVSGLAAGVATAAATGSAFADATGAAAGTSTASATSGQVSIGTASGTSTASATASALATASGTAAGSATAAATGSSFAFASGTAAGTSTATAVGSATGVVIPAYIVITGETWATPQISQQQWYAATVTSETWQSLS